MDGQTIGLIGGIAGGVIGVAGGLLGSWFSIRATRSAAERRFVVRWVIVSWIAVSAFLAVLFLLPFSYRWIAWVVYGPLLVVAVVAFNRGQARIRAEQGQSHPPT